MIKNLRYLLMALVVFAFSSCEKEEIGSTNTVAVAGEWMVQVDVVDASGDVAYEDPYGLGYVPMLTYNTNADNGKEMYVSDIGNFWLFTVKVPCDVNARTFGSSTPAPNEAYDERGNLYDIDVTVDKGKIIEKGTMSPSGRPVDSIEFHVSFSDDENFPSGYRYYVHGYRRTGLNGGAE